MKDALDIAFKAVPVLVPLITLVVTLARGPGALRSRLKHDIELVEKLPESAARESLLELIDKEVEGLAKFETTTSRNASMFVVALLAAPLLGYLTLWIIRDQNGWWTVPVAILSGFSALLFVYGIFETGQRVPRDKDGKRLDPGSNPPSPRLSRGNGS